MGEPASYDAIVLGAGAAGLFCAALAGERGRRVLVVDHGPRPGRKILISGGGRANFTNLRTTAEHFLSENPHFAKSALARYPPERFVELVESFGIRYHAKAPGQLFCDGSAAQIVEMLLALCRRTGCVEILLGFEGAAVVPTAVGGYTVAGRVDGQPRTVCGSALVIATGGLSIPKLGATGLGYELARQFGLRVVEPRPALVPLVFGAEDKERWAGLSGVSAEAVVSLGGRRGRAFQGPVLWTHRGLSGPAVLQLSSYWTAGETMLIDLAPGAEVYASLCAAGAVRDEGALEEALARVLPRRLAERIHTLGSPHSLRTAALEEAEATLHRWPVVPAGTEGFEKAEVTGGGISTAELNARTLESKRQPGLFAVGEVVDVTGHLGGYNFQWAWASAAAAAAAL